MNQNSDTLHLLKDLRLFFLSNFPGPTFIPCLMSIPRSHYQRVCITAKLQLPFMFRLEIVVMKSTGHFSARHDKKFKWKIKAYFRHLWQKNK